MNGNTYVGSSVNLGRRFRSYFDFNYIADTKRNMPIHKALLKYGYSNFTLEILEYCDSKSAVISREQYYIDVLKPEYNILKVAGSTLGFKHSEATLAKLRRRFAPEHLEKILAHLKNLNSKPFAPEVRAKITQGVVNFNIKTKGKKLIFTDLESKETFTFFSIPFFY